MGIGPDVIALLTQLQHTGILDGVSRVAEFGEQKMKLRYHAPIMREFLESRSDAMAFGEDQIAGACVGPSKNFFEMIGMDHVSFDTSGKNGAIVFDLNYDSVGADHRGSFDLLTNFGTVEHVFNQFNCFKVAHDLVRPGGLFMHYMPFLGKVDHGFYSFHPGLYQDLAATNGYEIIGLWINPKELSYYLIPWTTSVVEDLNIPATQASQIFCVMRKTEDNDFVAPHQGKYMSNYASEAFEARFGMSVNGMRTGVVSEKTAVLNISGPVLMRELRRRVVRKLRGMIGLKA